jgi:hypothetical protein
MLSVQGYTVRLGGVCAIGLTKSLLGSVHELSEDVTILKSNNASIKSKINKLHEIVCRLKGSLSSRVSLQADKKSLTHLKQPHVGIQPGAMPNLQFLDLCILLHL